MSTVSQGELLWQPSPERVQSAAITRFRDWVNATYRVELDDYLSLWRWSVADIERFWATIAQYYDVFEGSTHGPVLGDATMPGAAWFPDAQINFAEYLLTRGEPDSVAVYADSESVGERQLSWAGLQEQVKTLATRLRAAGVKPGDHVCAYLPISCEAVVGLLATAAVGAVWSSCSPDFGSDSVIERFSQVRPTVLLTVCDYRYGGKHHDRTADVQRMLDDLDSLALVIALPWSDPGAPARLTPGPDCEMTDWDAALATHTSDFTFAAVPFGHPLWVLYTSGTTGLPKGIVHGHGGVLLEFLKSGYLHDDLDSDSVKFFFTTTGWTMFNLLVGGLVTGGAIVVYDGNPTSPGPECLWELAERYGVTYFGASPSYVSALMAREYTPRGKLDLSTLRSIALTGSPASPEHFQWFYDHVHTDLHVFSMSGGTDVAAAFVGGVPTLPVHAGEIQAPGLGIDVCAADDDGQPLTDAFGEMIIRQPMPSMPLYLLDDPGFERYRDSYFDLFEGVWRQGDLIRFDNAGRCVISGRSDSTLNRHGIRVGTAEIYRTVEAIPGIADCLIVNLELPGAKFYMPLFVQLDDEQVLDEALIDTIRAALSQRCSPRHVPDEVHRIEEIPYTLSGKKMEVPVKKLLAGVAPEVAAKRDACRNPVALDYFEAFAGNHVKR